MKYLPLTNSERFIIVDDQDYSRLSEFKWWFGGGGIRTTTHPQIRIQNMIMGKAPKGKEWDHRNRVIFDNQRENLRPATKSQNQSNKRRYKNNSTGFTGVYEDDRNAYKKWYARIMVGEKYISLGTYSTAIEAALARDKAAKKHHGRFAVLNFPGGRVRFPRPYRFPR